MSPEPEQKGEIKFDQPAAQTVIHTVTELPSGAVVDRYTNPREKPQQKRK